MLQSLERRSGLPIALDPWAGTLEWPGNRVTVGRLAPRSFAEMRDFIAEPDAAPSSDPIYTVYREMIHTDDAERIRSAGLRYDITVIPPGHFTRERREFFRTAGHYHPLKPGAALAYPEVFEVLAGRAYWLIQRPEVGNPAVIEEIYAIEAGPGEKAVMLPGFGHISVNAFDEPLVMANWISDTFTYDYEPFRALRGAGYWLMAGEMSETIEFEVNSNYRAVPELKKLRPREVPEFDLMRSKPLYALVNDLNMLRFLNAPEEFTHTLTLDRCYRAVV